MAVLGPVPDLTEAQRIQLQSAVDRQAQFDGPAIFPLLRNALLWPVPVERAGATIPDYAAIDTSPSDHRGQLFLIEGDLARTVPTGALAQAGPWDNMLEEWDIVVATSPVRTAVVFLAEPPPAPRRGSRVALVARFYMLMRRRDVKHGEPTDFPIFVGRTASFVGGGSAGPGSAAPPVVLLLVVLALAAGYWFVRRSVRQQTAGEDSRRPAHAYSPNLGAHDADDADQSLVADPADALEQLARRDSDGDADQRAKEE